MLNAIKNICLNTPIFNVLCLVLFNGIFVKHYIEMYRREKGYTKEDMIKILRELKTPEEDIIKYLE